MYKTVSHLAEYADLCPAEVRRKIKGMKESGAYPLTAFLTNPIRVNLDAFVHFNTYQQLIQQGKPFPEWSTDDLCGVFED